VTACLGSNSRSEMNMSVKQYNPEKYWDEVAEHIINRSDNQKIAGDDEPYYRYKRSLFLKLFDKIDFHDKKVLEVGSGPGGNLDFLTNRGCKEIVGVDVSEKMLELSNRFLTGKRVRVQKIDGCSLPFDDHYFDLAFTSTVLQHNTDEFQLIELVKNICRVSNSDVVIFERIEQRLKGHETNLGRPIQYYEKLFAENNFKLIKTQFLRIQASYVVCGAIRKIFNGKNRREGEPISVLSSRLETIVLPVTRLFDKILPSRRDLAMLVFKKLPSANMENS
jgi:ubiquinone/menaquinone biosynthesis C-methylase UbiE